MTTSALDVTQSTSASNRFLARQPILTREKKLFGYEILSRYGLENYCRPVPGIRQNVNAVDELLLMGMRTMTDGHLAFMNCTREFLLSGNLTLLPREWVIAEILEDVTPDDTLRSAVIDLRKKGYRFALDDYIHGSPAAELLPFVDFVKVDVLMTALSEQKMTVDALHRASIPVIAEKVETDDQFRNCLKLGYDYFQGYFFCRPQILGRKDIPSNLSVHLQLLQEANKDGMDLRKVGDLIRQDVSLSYRLLRYLNSPAFALHSAISSIAQALSLLGESATKKWLSVVTVAAMAENNSEALLKLPLVRARFCELLALSTSMKRSSGELFLLGLLSVMDTLLSRPMADVLKEIPVSKEIRDALHGRPGSYRSVFEVVLDYESGTWEQLAASSRAIGLNENFLPDIQLRSVTWANQVVGDRSAPG